MGDIHKVAEPDHIIKDVVGKFPCRVLWSEGRPCLEYQREEDVALPIQIGLQRKVCCSLKDCELGRKILRIRRGFFDYKATL
ncbi:hypothetical protein CXK86_26205 [Paenibacillus sp. BGI2013]|nr:hypothetical protein BK136_26750 [Paenibacillus amylolyticus]PKQ88226.1 hypothetical protein CXK86_26205 [Paenibacillus sp. BGI2013]